VIQPKRTPLHETHIALGARMVEFAGWLMPVQYAGIIAEHQAVRRRAGLFDLCHMGILEVRGPGALRFLERVTTNDPSRLTIGRAQYSLLCQPDGGVIDDLIVYRVPQGFVIVANAVNTETDYQWLLEQQAALGVAGCEVLDCSAERGNIAIQGPLAQQVLQQLTRLDLHAIRYFHHATAEVAGIPMQVCRTGYTGEDGFELLAPRDRAVELWHALLDAGKSVELVPCGLGARDTLRTEAGLPLYGHELTREINPYEANLGWVVKLSGRVFVGSEALHRIEREGPARRIVGLTMLERGGVPRQDYPVQRDGEQVGHVTSGTYSPTLDANIALALVRRDAASADALDVVIRGRPMRARVTPLPFYRGSVRLPAARSARGS
jgi:aminomethyltransferase